MRIQRVEIQNFKALQSIDVPLDRTCVLIGENDVGKTSFLQALDVFFIGKKLSDKEFWYKPAADQDIQLTLTFSDLPEEVLKEYRRKDGTVKIRKLFSFEKPPTVTAVQDDETTVLVPKATVDEWFSSNRFHFIPVRRDLAVQFSMAKTALLGKTLRAQMKKSLAAADAGQSLQKLQAILTESISEHRARLEGFLQEQLHDDKIKLGFEDLEIDAVEGVRFAALLSDDKMENIPIQNRGAGTQNNLIIALFRLIAEIDMEGYLILAMEEPENSLHPKAQRQLLSVIQEIGLKTQVIVTTHSPVFIDRSRYESNILLTRTAKGDAIARTFNPSVIDQVRTDLGIRASDALLKGGGNCALLVEGRTEEDGFPVFMEMCSMSEFRLGLAIINMDGSDSVKVHKIAQLLHAYSIPCVIVLDRNAQKTADDLERASKASLSNIRRVFCLKKGNIEDYYPLEVVADVINQEFEPEKPVSTSDFDESLSGKERLDDFERVMKAHITGVSLRYLKQKLGGLGARLIKERNIPLDPELVEIFEAVREVAQEN